MTTAPAASDRVSQPMIALHGITKGFGGKPVLAGLDLEIESGETHVILGRSGTGKSVLLKLISGLLAADAGTITIEGQRLDARNPASLRRARGLMQMLFQGGALFDSLTVAQNVAFHATEHGQLQPAAAEAFAAQYLELVELAGAGPLLPAELSGGMRKRAALARALAVKPRIMLYDEPTTGLDPLTSQVINRLIRETQQRFNVTALVVTHDLRSAQEVGDRCSFLEDGRIQETVRPAELLQARQPLLRAFAQEAILKF